MSFTEGPWSVVGTAGNDLHDAPILISSNCNPDGTERRRERGVLPKNGGMMVAHCLGKDKVANAKAIAALPDMYAALKLAEGFLWTMSSATGSSEVAAAHARVCAAIGSAAAPLPGREMDGASPLKTSSGEGG